MAYTVEDFPKINLPDLNKHGYLSPNPQFSRVTFWNRIRTEKLGFADFIFLSSLGLPDQSRMLVAGHLVGKTFQSIIPMSQVVSNLGRGGGQWYFLCPVSGRRCRTLLFNGSQFVSRQALGVHYDSQMDSRFVKSFVSNLIKLKRFEQYRDDWYFNPKSRMYYNDKPTRKMKRWLRFIELAAKANNHFVAENAQYEANRRAVSESIKAHYSSGLVS